MILQFAGDLEPSSAQFIEIFEYLPKEHRFRFPLINFNALGSAELFIEDASFIDFTKLSQPEAFSGVSPCSTCHYSSRSTYSPNLAPRWTPYPISMPAYGRLADQIKMGSTEHEQWLDFERKLDSSAAQRYRRVLLSSRQETDGNLRFIDRPNRHLSQTLNHMKADRLAFAMTSHPTWPKLKFAIAGGLASCSEIAGFLPDSYRNLHEAEFLARLRKALPVESKNWLALDRLIADRLPSDARRQGNEVYLSLDKFVAASSLSLEDTLGEWTRTSSESNLEYLYRMFPEPFQKPGPEIFGMSVKLIDNGRERINLKYKDLSKSNTIAKLWYLLAPFYEDQIISSGFGALSMQRAFDDDEIEIGVLSQLRTLLQAKFAADQSLAFSSDTQTQGKNCEVLRRESLAALQGLEPKTSRFREPMQPISSGSFTISDPSSRGQLVIEIPNLGLSMTPINPDSRKR
ncbi:MAG: hypothetical protein NTX25_19560 [Proteobacteria bacterium]|nr:hypothetical protein [Pseudomonadota bacterium]